MNPIKEVCGKYCILRTRTYAKSYEYVSRLVAAAKQDFPALQDRDIRVVAFGGDRIKEMMGIEFEVPSDGDIPDSYSPIHEMYPLLA